MLTSEQVLSDALAQCLAMTLQGNDMAGCIKHAREFLAWKAAQRKGGVYGKARAVLNAIGREVSCPGRRIVAHIRICPFCLVRSSAVQRSSAVSPQARR